MLVPCGMASWSRGLDVRTCAERSAEAEHHRCEQEDADFGPEAAGAEFLDAGFSEHDEAADDEGDREERNGGVEDLAVDLDVAVDASGVCVEGVEGLHGAGNEHDEGQHDEDVDELEGEGEAFVPAEVRVRRSDDTLCEYDVDNEEEDDACRDEDLGGDGDSDVCRACGPDDAHDAGNYS